MNNDLSFRYRFVVPRVDGAGGAKGAAILRAGCATLVVVTCMCAKEPLAPSARPAASRAVSAPATSSAPAGRPLAWPRPRFDDGRAERLDMVARQIATSLDGREPVRDPRVLEAMREVPRHLFVPKSRRASAYADHPLPVGHGQTISQPYIVALMTEALQLPPGGSVLEIGTATGYQAAVLAELTPHVYTIEIVKPLADDAAERLRRLGYVTVRTRCGDGYFGWPEAAPFDGILVTCAAERMPEALWGQLKPGGRIVVPIGREGAIQQLTVITKAPDGKRRSDVLIPCVFVPMTGKIRER